VVNDDLYRLAVNLRNLTGSLNRRNILEKFRSEKICQNQAVMFCRTLAKFVNRLPSAATNSQQSSAGDLQISTEDV